MVASVVYLASTRSLTCCTHDRLIQT